MCKSKTLRKANCEASGPHFGTPNGSEIGPQIREKTDIQSNQNVVSKKAALLQDLAAVAGLLRHQSYSLSAGKLQLLLASQLP